MKKLILASIIAISFAMPSMADIAANANSATCNSGTLNTASGTSNLTAQWTPNTINITWDNNNATSGGTGGDTQCTYSSDFDIPSIPSRTGYTFGGWALKVAAAPAQCSLSELNANLVGSSRKSKNLAGDYCYYYNDSTDDEIEDACVDNVFSNLNAGEWEASFNYGVVKGIAKCSSTNGTFTQTGNPSDTSGQYCWCQATTYTANGGSACPVSESSWVCGYDEEDNWDNCADKCAGSCGFYVQRYSSFRRTVFGVSN